MASIVNPVLWAPTPEAVAKSQLNGFRRRIEERTGESLLDSRALHAWSVRNPGAFWSEVWSYCGVIGEQGDTAVTGLDRMPGAKWFPQARLSFAQNLLHETSDRPALVFCNEGGTVREVTFAQLNAEVSRVAQALEAAGIRRGDRVGAYLPNMPEAVVYMLATSSLGAIWSSCSPDFGAKGVIDRFGQIEPKALITVDAYQYGGKVFPMGEKVREVLAALPTVETTVVVRYMGEGACGVASEVSHDDFVAPYAPGPLRPEALPFDHPLYVLYSSGTTGKPKCIVHGAGGTLLQHLKEHRLHLDLGPGQRLFYYTTCGWMMWNWLVSGLATGATLILYDGSPSAPTANVLFDMADRERVNVLGTSAKFIDALHKAGLRPRETHRLDSVRAILSTGSPLSPESFDFVYADVKADVHLASISGGTDIVSCFVLGDPTQAVRRGEIQAKGLGMDVQVWNDEGQRVVGEQGELVCCRPFPSMPVGFWGDADGSRYQAAYFERFPGVWCHGDFTEETGTGGFIITGRSDATLNPGGVRIGTAEIYRQVEALDEIVESVAIGQPWEGDVRIVLFVVLREGLELTDGLRDTIKRKLRKNASPRHVPARVLQVPTIPRTRSGKISELTVQRAVCNQPIKNVEALANPEALKHYRDLPELAV